MYLANWQFISSFIDKKIESEDLQQNREFAIDLLSLFVKKRLRSFEGITNIIIHNKIRLSDNIFYNVNTSKFKGEFSGFTMNLQGFKKILSYQKIYQKSFFTSLNNIGEFNNQTVFYNGK